MATKLEVVPALKDAVAIGIKNVASLVLTALFYVLTVWIPYLNVGTTIAMATIPGKLAKGEIINPTFIFDSVYRRRMGSYFLLQGFLFMMLVPAFFFMIIPGYVLTIMYSLALYIMLDKDVTPTEALELSNQATYGYKWKIFFLYVIYGVAFCILFCIINAICDAINVGFITLVLDIAVMVCGITCAYALVAVIYRNLFLGAEAEQPAAPAAEAAVEEA